MFHRMSVLALTAILGLAGAATAQADGFRLSIGVGDYDQGYYGRGPGRGYAPRQDFYRRDYYRGPRRNDYYIQPYPYHRRPSHHHHYHGGSDHCYPW